MRFLRRGGREEEPPVERDAALWAVDERESGGDADLGIGAEDADGNGVPSAGSADGGDERVRVGHEREPAARDAEPEPGDDDAEAEDDVVADDAEAEPVAGDAEAEPAADEAEDDVVADDAEAEDDVVADDAEAEPADAEADPQDFDGLSDLVARGVSPHLPEAPIPEDAGPDPLAGGRAPALRIAGLHLRTGQHSLARAELEALAGRGRLDEAALLDLAEVRWRTGDLSGAGDTANALIARGNEAPLALVIAAEAVAAAGRPMEARRLSARAIEVADGPLDPLFAGMPRAMIWPVASASIPAPETPRRRARRPRAEGDGAPTTAAEAFAGGRAALARGDANRAGLLLGVAMRLEPGFAEDVLRAVMGRDDQPLLALVRGDALRLLGREAEALDAFDRARGRSAISTSQSDAAPGPGLFDDEQG